MPDDEKLPFTAHLEELRRRLIICFSAVGIGFVISYFFSKRLFELLKQPLEAAMPLEQTVISTGLQESFIVHLKVAFVAGLLLAVPVIMYQLWMFIAPGLYHREKRLVLPIVFLSSVFFLGGSLFGYFVVFPFGFKFLVGFASDSIKLLPRAKEYLGFSTKLLFAFGVVFELPLFVTFLAKLGIVNVQFLKAKRKYAILLFFVFASILTPPDVITQIMMAAPLIVLYEVSILGARVFGKKETKADAKETQESAG
ncbi:MAG: twin-arginine translocase subunit TatC [Desulfobacterales bacterium]|nr:twin-arginine translocase subunit TatC [Desulfobacterales bacterium]